MNFKRFSFLATLLVLFISLFFTMSLGIGAVYACDDCTEGVVIDHSSGIAGKVNNASNGGTLNLADGVYNVSESIIVDKNLTIKGNSKSGTVINASSNNAFIVEKGNTLTLTNLTIISNYFYNGNDAANYGGVVHTTNGSVNGGGNVNFYDCNFVNNNNNKANINIVALPSYTTSTITFTAHVKDLNGNIIYNGDIAFFINNLFSGRVPIINGIAVYSLNLPNGDYTVHASYVDGHYDKVDQNQVSFNVNAPMLISPLGSPIPSNNTSIYWYVDPVNGNDTNTLYDGRSPGLAKRSIQAAYDAAPSGSIIILLPGVYSGTGNVGITLSNKANMTIWGNDTAGDVIISTGTSTFITISQGTATNNQRTLNLHNMRIIGTTGNKIVINANNIVYIDSLHFTGLTGAGASIYISGNYVDVTVNNTLFNNSIGGTGQSTSGAKGIQTSATTTAYGSLSVYNSNFTNLRGGSGTAINYMATSTCSLYINNTNFLNVTGNDVGGVIRCYYGAGVTINHTNFTNSGVTSSSHGGIFCLNGAGSYLVVDNSRFTNVSTNNGQGGVTYTHLGPTTIYNTIFEDCSGGTGGVFYNNGNDPIVLVNCNFTNNRATSGTGGAIHNQGSGAITLTNCMLNGNYAATNGGAIYNNGIGLITFNNSNFNNNRANTDGGALYANNANSNMRLFNSNFINNSAGARGGALYSGGGTTVFDNSTFENNSAVTYGGAVAVVAGTVNVTNARFINNNVTGAAGFGGAIGATGGTFNLNNAVLRGNYARTYGGALGVSGTSTVNVVNSNLTYNTAGTYGGAVGIAGGNFFGNMSNFDHNTATTYGGAVGAVAALNISNCNFTYNVAGGNGGAIGSYSGATVNNTVVSNNFMYNSAGTDGNAIWAAQRLTLNYNRLVSNFNHGSTSPYNTVCTNTSVAAGGVNVDYNWWGNNFQYATGVQPNNFIVVDVDLDNVGFWNGSAHYIYTIRTNVTAAGSVDPTFNPFRLPTFYGEAHIVMAPPNNYTRSFDAHINNTDITVPFNLLAYQIGYFQVDNWRTPVNNSTYFNISTRHVPNVILGDTTGRYNDTVTLNATFGSYDFDGNFHGIAGLNVSFYMNGTLVGWNITNADGVAYYQYRVPSAGTYNYTVVYTQANSLSIDPININYNSTNSQRNLFFRQLNTTIVNVTNVTGRSGLPVGLNATIIDENGNFVGNVILYFSLANGTVIYSGSSNSAGYVGGSYIFPVRGNYSYYVYFAGNGNYSASNSSQFRAEISPAVNLTITKNVSTTNVLNLQNIFYTVTVTNNGPDNATNVTVTDFIDAGLIYLNNTGGASYNSATRVVTWSVGNLNVGQSASLIIHVQVNSTGSIDNVANVTVNEPNIGDNTTEGKFGANITVLPTVNLTILKTVALPPGYTFGSNIVYTITVTNNGPDNGTNVTVRDYIDSKLIFNTTNNTANASYNSATRVVTWNIGNLNKDQTVSLTVTVRIDGTGNIPNVANVTVTENNIGMNSSDQNMNSNGTNIVLPDTVNLTIRKTVSAPAIVTVGDNVNYTITVTNNGPDNGTGVVVRDLFDSRLVYVSNNGGTNVTVSGNLVTWNIGNLNVGQTVSLTVTARVNGTGNIPNVANVTVNQPNVGMNNSDQNVDSNPNIYLGDTVNLTIRKTVSVPSGLTVGSTVTYTITVTNNGPDNGTGVVVRDLFDSRLVYVSNTGGPAVNVTGNLVTWNIGNLNVGQTVSLAVTVRVNGTGTIANVANVTVDQPNVGMNNSGQNVDSNATLPNIPPTVNLTILKTVSVPSGLTVGSHVNYTITVTNNGPDNGTNVTVRDLFDSRLVYVSNNNGTHVVVSGNLVTWNIGNLNVGQTVSLTVTVRVNGTGTIANVANVTVDQPNVGMNNSGQNVDSNATLPYIPPTVNLTITKTVSVPSDVTVGSNVVYTITVTNHGPDNGTYVNVTDVLDNRLVYVSNNGTPGSVTNSGNTITWRIGNLNVGQTVSLNITVRVSGTGTIDNVATVVVTQINVGMNSSNQSTDSKADFDIGSTVNLTILKTVSVPSGLTVGSHVTYTITVTNNGPDNGTGVVVRDLFDSRLVYVSNTGGPAVNVSGNLVTWNIGNLNKDQTVSLDITVRVIGTGNIPNVANVTVNQPNVGMNNSDQNVNSNATLPNIPPTVNLTITKTVSVPSGVTVGSHVNYTITVRNNGPDNGTNIVITDVLDVKLSYVSNNGGATVVGNTVTWTIPTLNVGANATLTITAQVVGSGNITNVANVTSVTQPNVGMNNTGNVTFNSGNAVNLTFSKTMYLPDDPNTGYGSQIVYTISVFNNGPDAANNLNVWDVLDSRLAFVSASPSQGNYNALNGRWTVGSLANGTDATLTITVRIIGTGTIGNIANLTVNEYNVGNNVTERVTVTIDPTVNLTITKTASIPVGVTVGSQVTYTITVTNHGPNNGTGVVVGDLLDSRLIYRSSSATRGSYNPSTGVWNVGNLNVGETVRLNIVVQVNGTGLIENVANVTVTQINVGMNNTESRMRDVELFLVPTVNLTVTKTATPMKTYYGNEVRYTITVKNNGPDNATNVVLTDKLDPRLVYVNHGADTGTYNPATGVWAIGDIELGDSYSLIIITRVMGTGNITNVARVTVDQPNVGMYNRSVTVEVPKIVTNSSVSATGEFKVDKPMTISGVAYDQFGNRFANIGLNVVIDGNTYSVTTRSDGSWSFVVSEHRYGTFAVVVSWGGNASHAAFTNSTTVVVERYATTLDIYTKNIQEGKDAVITLHLKDHLGNNMANHKVTKTIAGKTYTGTTNKNGMVTFKVKNLKGKKHAVKGLYDGTDYHGNSIVNRIQVVHPRVDLAIVKIKLIKATNKRTNSQFAYYKVTIQNKGSLKSKATKILSWHIRKGIMVENKYKKIKPLKGGQKKTLLFKYYPDKDYHKYCMSGQYFVLNPKKAMKEIGYKNNKALVLGKAKIKRNFGFSWNPKSYKKNDPKYHKKINNFARTL